MTKRGDDDPDDGRQAAKKTGDRAARLAEALRINLQRRKAQARLRRGGEDTEAQAMQASRPEDEADGFDDTDLETTGPDPLPPKGLRKPGRT